MNIFSFIITLSLCFATNAYFLKYYADGNCTGFPTAIHESPTTPDRPCIKHPLIGGAYVKSRCTTNQIIEDVYRDSTCFVSLGELVTGKFFFFLLSIENCSNRSLYKPGHFVL